MRALRVSTFPNAKALPLWVCRAAGIAGAAGLAIELHETGSSQEQRDALAAGDVQIVQAAVDNAVEMIASGSDVVIFMGGEGGMNDLVAQASIRSIEELRGKCLAVDSPHTAYALLARELLSRYGLQFGTDYEFRAIGNGSRRLEAMTSDPTLAAAILNPPFTAIAVSRGMHVLADVDALAGPYQAGGGFALRSWLASHQDVAVDYVRCYRQALAWIRSNRDAASRMLVEHLSIEPGIAVATWEKLCDPAGGFQPDARLDLAGVENLLRIRAATDPRASSLSVARVVDETIYDQASMIIGGKPT